MNQILITEKLYVTPELKRKKKMYKVNFLISVFLVCILFSYYIYAEYDRSKSEKISQEIMANIDLKDDRRDDTTIKVEDNVLFVVLDEDEETDQEVNIMELLQEDPTVMYTSESGETYYIAATLKIPKLDLNYPVLSETSDELLKNALTKFWGPDANEVGNFVIAGHNYKNKKFFGRLSELTINDVIELTDPKGKTIKYNVYDIYTVDPNDIECTSQLTEGRREVTLVTCTPSGKQRLVIKAAQSKV